MQLNSYINYLSKYDIIVFDFDGVLANTLDLKSKILLEVYKKYGLDFQKKIFRYQKEIIGKSRIEKFRLIHNNILGISITKKEVENLDNKFRTGMIFHLEKIKIYPKVKKILELLRYKKNKNIFCVSASPINELSKILKYNAMNEHFIKIYGAPTKKIESFKDIKKLTKSNYNSMLYIGDTKFDLSVAKEKNINFLGFGKNEKWSKNIDWIHRW